MSTSHFTDEELTCQCGCGGLPPQDLQDELEELRIAFGEPMVISSGYRCPAHNDAVSGTGLDGPHTKGAFDVLISGSAAHRLLSAAVIMGWTGIGISQRGDHAKRFIHIDRLDNETRPWVWSYA